MPPGGAAGAQAGGEGGEQDGQKRKKLQLVQMFQVCNEIPRQVARQEEKKGRHINIKKKISTISKLFQVCAPQEREECIDVPRQKEKQVLPSVLSGSSSPSSSSSSSSSLQSL